MEGGQIVRLVQLRSENSVGATLWYSCRSHTLIGEQARSELRIGLVEVYWVFVQTRTELHTLSDVGLGC